MLSLEFTEEERRALHHERFHHPHPRVQQKMEALWLKSHNLPHAQIAELVQISEETLRAYLRAYQEGGIEKLKAIPWQGPESELSQHQSTLKDFFCRVRRLLSPMPQRKSKG
jgi:transposase